MLQEDAAEWWTGTREVTFWDEEEVEWDEFKEFTTKYLPRHLFNELRDEFQNLMQGNLTVPKYAMKSVRMEWHILGIFEDKEEKERKFIAGLDSSLRLHIMVARLMNLKETVALADTLEKELKRNQVKKKASEEGTNQGGVKRIKGITVTQTL